MNENIDLVKTLEGCPRGTKFYTTVYGEASLVCIVSKDEYPIKLLLHESCVNVSLTKKGTYSIYHDGECLLFPSKDQRDWSKFERFWDTKVERFDPKTLKPFDKVLVRDDDCYWTADLFSHIDDSIGKVCCSVFLWKQCIPYNEETKHLVGTKEDCPEYYKWWEK